MIIRTLNGRQELVKCTNGPLLLFAVLSLASCNLDRMRHGVVRELQNSLRFFWRTKIILNETQVTKH